MLGQQAASRDGVSGASAPPPVARIYTVVEKLGANSSLRGTTSTTTQNLTVSISKPLPHFVHDLKEAIAATKFRNREVPHTLPLCMIQISILGNINNRADNKDVLNGNQHAPANTTDISAKILERGGRERRCLHDCERLDKHGLASLELTIRHEPYPRHLSAEQVAWKDEGEQQWDYFPSRVTVIAPAGELLFMGPPGTVPDRTPQVHPWRKQGEYGDAFAVKTFQDESGEWLNLLQDEEVRVDTRGNKRIGQRNRIEALIDHCAKVKSVKSAAAACKAFLASKKFVNDNNIKKSRETKNGQEQQQVIGRFAHVNSMAGAADGRNLVLHLGGKHAETPDVRELNIMVAEDLNRFQNAINVRDMYGSTSLHLPFIS
ncbi:unnamed protein product, partial [Amoebophrya sp. A25]|eukprot:GSA25T00016584001.1